MAPGHELAALSYSDGKQPILLVQERTELHGVVQLRLVGWLFVGTGGLEYNFSTVSGRLFFCFVFNLDYLVKKALCKVVPYLLQSWNICVSLETIWRKDRKLPCATLWMEVRLQNAMIWGIS